MRKGQITILERADHYEIKPCQRLLLESENYSVDYYSMMLSYFIRANKENMDVADTCEVVNLVYERFLHLPGNRRRRLWSRSLFHAVESVEVVVAMINDSRSDAIGCINNGGEYILGLSIKYAIEYDRIIQTVLELASSGNLEQSEVIHLIDRGMDITDTYQEAVKIAERYLFKYSRGEHAFGIFDYLENVKKIRKLGLTLEEAENLSFNYERCVAEYFSRYFEPFTRTYPYTGYKWFRAWYYTESGHLLKKLMELEITGDVDFPMNRLEYEYKDTGITFKFIRYSSIRLYRDSEDEDGTDEIEFKGSRIQGQLKLYVMKDMVLMKAGYKTEKNVPVTMKRLAQFYEERDDDAFRNFLEVLAAWAEQRGIYIFKDALPYIKKGLFLPPIGLHEMLKEATLADALKSKYKGIKNWKRNDINLLYATIKSADYVNAKSKQKLLNYDDPGILQRAGIRSKDSFKVTKKNFRENGVMKLLYQWYLERLSAEDEGVDIIYDYILMCLQMKEPVNLGFISVKKIKEAHDRVLEKNYHRIVPVVKVPKKSRFDKLRTLLPAEFERITSRKRLIKESMMQHHCVWSYADLLNDDKSAIYSFIFEPEQKRYTVEFKRKGNREKYYIAQIQCVWNRSCSREAFDYVNGFLKL